MPKPNQSGRKRFFYNQNIKRDKSGKKYKNLIDHTIILARRIETEGLTKWLSNEVVKTQIKIKSYGITMNQVQQALDHKGLSNLAALIAEKFHFVTKKGATVSSVVVEPKKATKAAPKKTTSKKESDAPKKTTTKKATTKTTTKKETTKKATPKAE